MAKAPNPRDPDGAKAEAVKAAEERARRKAAAFNEFELKVHVGGEVFSFCAGDVTARHVGLLRQATGSTWTDPVWYIIEFLDQGNAAPDMIAQLVYLARLQAGERVAYEVVADSITGRTEVWVESSGEKDPGGEGAVFLDPPASGGV